MEEEIESDSDAAAQPSPTWPSPAEPVNSESDDSDDLDEQICQRQAGARIQRVINASIFLIWETREYNLNII